MKTNLNRILSTALAAVMALLLVLPASAAAASEEPWVKTNPYKSPLSQYLAMPGQYFIKNVVLPQLLGGLGETLKGVTEGLYTDETVNMILLAQREIEFDISQGSATSHQYLRPHKVSAGIKAYPDTTEKYEAIWTALDSVMIGNATGGNAANTAKEWAAVDELIAAGALAWGVTDRASFMEAAGVALRPLLNLLCHRTLNFRGEDGVYAQAILPGLEALGCKNVLSLEEFEAMYLAALRKVGSATSGLMADINAINAKMQSDFALAAILNPIFDLLEELQADPQGKLISMLPNAAYRRNDITALLGAAVINGGEETKIFEALGGALGLDLSGSFEDVVAKALEGMPVNLPPIPWKALAGAGDLDAETNTVIADESIVYALLIGYVYDVMNKDPRGVQSMLSESLNIPSWVAVPVFYLLKGVVLIIKPR